MTKTTTTPGDQRPPLRNVSLLRPYHLRNGSVLGIYRDGIYGAPRDKVINMDYILSIDEDVSFKDVEVSEERLNRLIELGYDASIVQNSQNSQFKNLLLEERYDSAKSCLNHARKLAQAGFEVRIEEKIFTVDDRHSYGLISQQGLEKILTGEILPPYRLVPPMPESRFPAVCDGYLSDYW